MGDTAVVEHYVLDQARMLRVVVQERVKITQGKHTGLHLPLDVLEHSLRLAVLGLVLDLQPKAHTAQSVGQRPTEQRVALAPGDLEQEIERALLLVGFNHHQGYPGFQHQGQIFTSCHALLPFYIMITVDIVTRSPEVHNNCSNEIE